MPIAEEHQVALRSPYCDAGSRLSGQHHLIFSIFIYPVIGIFAVLIADNEISLKI